MRVVLASERTEVQNLLMDVVEEEPGAIVVGQAENATKALDLVKNLRPDVAIVDGNLPYSVGMDSVAFSRISGLDTAQTICEMMPRTRVIIINNLEAQVLPGIGLSEGSKLILSRERIEGNTVFKLGELRRGVALPQAPVFASVEVKPWSIPKKKDKEAGAGAMFSGITSILGGGYLIGTLILAPIGFFLALAGVLMLCFGLFRKITAQVWRK